MSYPIRCVVCGKHTVNPTTREFRGGVRLGNQLYEIVVPKLPANKCDNCGMITATEAGDAKVQAALRAAAKNPSTPRRHLYEQDLEYAKAQSAVECRSAALNDAQFAYIAAMARQAKRLAELRSEPCPYSPTGRHAYRGFAESVGECEHCGIDGGFA